LINLYTIISISVFSFLPVTKYIQYIDLLGVTWMCYLHLSAHRL